MLNHMRHHLARWLMPKSARSGSQDVDRLYNMLLQRSPPTRTGAELVAAYKNVPEFRMVVSKIADHVASVRWRLYVVRGKGGKARVTRTGWISDHVARRKDLSRYKSTGELEEVEDHPMATILDRANPFMSGFAARRLSQIYLDVVGESFSVLSRDHLRTVFAYWPMPPTWITPPEPGKDFFRIKIPGSTGNLEIPPDDMLWTRDLDPANPYSRGAGVGESLGDELDISEFSSKYVKAFFYNSGRPDMLVALDGMTEDQGMALQAKFDAEYRGYARAHRTWFTGGKLSVQELNSKFADMQVVELKGKVRDSFVNTFGVPPEIFGILANSNRATIREALRLFVSETIVPRLERQRDEWQHKIAPLYDDRLIVDFDDPTPIDPEDQSRAMSAAPWAATRGEWRETQGWENRGEIDDVHMVPIGLMARRPDDMLLLSPIIEPESDPQRDTEEDKNVKSCSFFWHVHKDKTVNVLEALRPERLTYELTPLWTEQIEKWGNGALTDLGLSTAFDMRNPLVTEHLARFAGLDYEGQGRIKDLVNGTTADALRSELVAGVRAGEGVRDLAKRVRDVFADAQGYRARSIARTEVMGSSNFATFTAHKQSGIVKKRQWISTPDGATRDAHINSPPNGQIVGIDEPFSSGGEKLMYPGDWSGSAWNTVQCRCTTIAVFGDQQLTQMERDAIWKVYDRSIIPWEIAAVEALQRGFKAQLHDVLLALDHEFV